MSKPPNLSAFFYIACKAFRSLVRKGNDVTDALVISFGMVVFDVFIDDQAQGLLSE